MAFGIIGLGVGLGPNPGQGDLRGAPQWRFWGKFSLPKSLAETLCSHWTLSCVEVMLETATGATVRAEQAQ